MSSDDHENLKALRKSVLGRGGPQRNRWVLVFLVAFIAAAAIAVWYFLPA